MGLRCECDECGGDIDSGYDIYCQDCMEKVEQWYCSAENHKGNNDFYKRDHDEMYCPDCYAEAAEKATNLDEQLEEFKETVEALIEKFGRLGDNTIGLKKETDALYTSMAEFKIAINDFIIVKKVELDQKEKTTEQETAKEAQDNGPSDS